MNLDGLVTYARVLISPRVAFARLAVVPTWGWAAIAGIVMTLAAMLIAEQAQLHMLALSEAHRIAALPPSERLRERVATAQVAPFVASLFVVGALVTPWFTWALIATFVFIAAAIGRGAISIAGAWVATLNSSAVYGLQMVVNALLVARQDPNSLRTALDLVRLPSPAWFFPHDVALASFLTAYNILSIWYYVVMAIALERLMRMPRPAAAIAAFVYSLLCGFFAAAATRGGP